MTAREQRACCLTSCSCNDREYYRRRTCYENDRTSPAVIFYHGLFAGCTMIDLAKKLVLLDRDGVLNKDRGDYVTTPEELIVLTNALRGMAALTAAGVRIGICTNQGGIERGRYDATTLARIHQKLLDQARFCGAHIERIVYCESCCDSHPWRKPNPGMLLDQAAYFETELSGVPFVGDNIVDIEAARAAGAEPVLVKTGKGRKVAARHKNKLEGVLRYPNLEEAVKDWLK